MKITKLFTVLIFLTLIFIFSCEQEEDKVKNIEIIADYTEIKVDSIIQLEAVVYLESGKQLPDQEVIWKSYNSSIANVNENGLVTGLSLGSVKISASYQSISSEINITVIPYSLSHIEIVTDTTEVKEYLNIQLEAKIFRENGEEALDKKVTWSSADQNVASVSETGIVKGISVGTTKILATCEGIGSEIEITVLSNPVSTLEILNFQDELVVSYTVNLEAKILLESGDTLVKPELINWSVDDYDAATITNNQLLGIKEKTVTVSASIGDLTQEKTIFISAVEDNEIPTYLSTPAEGFVAEVPIVIIRFLPTNDGVNIDVTKDCDFYVLGEISLDDMRDRIDVYDKRIKFSLEDGSKYRGYKNTEALPYLGYKVVKYFTIYESQPASNIGGLSDGGLQYYLPDYFSMFERLGMESLVNNQGVKEVWIWAGSRAMPSYPSYEPALHDPITPVGAFESNMSSPETGDISNSFRNTDDLPVYNSTYVVYGLNTRRTQAEAVHNHGHQLESILSYIAKKQDGNADLFWKDFVGRDGENYSIAPIGRVGDTHHPPNTNEDYDYLNTTLVESDIEDWKPNNSGNKKMVNVDTWGNLIYNWPGSSDFSQRKESQWYLFWMQNMPGYQNIIPYSTNKNLTNWWIFTSDWDNAINSNIGLHE